MKHIITLFTILLFTFGYLMSQNCDTETCQTLLNAARKFLNEGNCDKAEEKYMIYQKFGCEKRTDIEAEIRKCKDPEGEGTKVLQPNVLRHITIGNQDYEIMPNDIDGEYEWENAKLECFNLTAFGKNDWYLPEKKELNVIYRQRKAIGGFVDGWYWSSSEYDTENAWGNYKGNSKYYYKFVESHVRCIRKVLK